MTNLEMLFVETTSISYVLSGWTKLKGNVLMSGVEKTMFSVHQALATYSLRLWIRYLSLTCSSTSTDPTNQGLWFVQVHLSLTFSLTSIHPTNYGLWLVQVYRGSDAVRWVCSQMSLKQVLEPKILADLPMSKWSPVDGQTDGQRARCYVLQWQLVPANIQLLLAV